MSNKCYTNREGTVHMSVGESVVVICERDLPPRILTNSDKVPTISILPVDGEVGAYKVDIDQIYQFQGSMYLRDYSSVKSKVPTMYTSGDVSLTTGPEGVTIQVVGEASETVPYDMLGKMDDKGRVMYLHRYEQTVRVFWNVKGHPASAFHGLTLNFVQ